MGLCSPRRTEIDPKKKKKKKLKVMGDHIRKTPHLLFAAFCTFIAFFE